MPKILVAEDEPLILKLYQILLENAGYEIQSTIDGQECLDAYKNELNKMTEKNNNVPFDLVILDHRMPKKNGVDVAKEILALCPAQKLLMVAAYAGHLDLQDGTLKKMQVMEKPFDPEELLATIAWVMTH